MKSNRVATVICSMLLAVFFAGTVLCRSQVEKLRGKEVTLEEVLYMPSGKSVKRMSLGYSSLLADIYWTRAVQYFGDKLNQRSMRYDLLYPLLDITTDLDPHVKDTAIQHLTSLRAEEDIEQLEQRVKIYRGRTGMLPSRWLDMVRAGILPGLPQDPNGAEYKLQANGTVDVQDPAKFRFLDRSHNK